MATSDYDEQLAGWLRGEPKHGDQCVPDFSCCEPSFLQPLEVRQAFIAASRDERMKFMGTFLAAAIAAHTSKKVHIAGRGGPE